MSSLLKSLYGMTNEVNFHHGINEVPDPSQPDDTSPGPGTNSLVIPDTTRNGVTRATNTCTTAPVAATSLKRRQVLRSTVFQAAPCTAALDRQVGTDGIYTHKQICHASHSKNASSSAENSIRVVKFPVCSGQRIRSAMCTKMDGGIASGSAEVPGSR
ncbi:hypothetical protein FS749_001442 [Ceratobasidium sp. UAMH 11750]|nr:hypothetical protein FS749_001442 [Ceratobasidium sp. UAMH 11750]